MRCGAFAATSERNNATALSRRLSRSASVASRKRAAIDGARPEHRVLRRREIVALGVAEPPGGSIELAREQQRGGARIPLAERAPDLQPRVARGAVELEGAGERHALRRGARRQR